MPKSSPSKAYSVTEMFMNTPRTKTSALTTFSERKYPIKGPLSLEGSDQFAIIEFFLMIDNVRLVGGPGTREIKYND